MVATSTTVAYVMASLYRRPDSRYWWVQYVDLAGERRQHSTKFRCDNTLETRKAHDLRRELTLREQTKLGGGEAWEIWVPRFLDQRYGAMPVTLSRYQNSWRNISVFLHDRQIYVPRQLSRQQVRDYVDWRQQRHAGLGVYEVSKNTALHEVKLLRILMREAVDSGFCNANPCERLNIKADRPEKKPRITDEEHKKILRALESEPEWMRISYLIAWEQGCRFSETCLPLSDVDLQRGVIHFRTKGHKDERAEFPLSPNLRPLFEKLIHAKRKFTYEMPAMPGERMVAFLSSDRFTPSVLSLHAGYFHHAVLRAWHPARRGDAASRSFRLRGA